MLSLLKEYRLLPADTTRALCHIGHGEKAIPLIANRTFRKQQFRNLGDGAIDCSSHICYVNQFHLCCGEVNDYKENVYFGSETAQLC